MEEEKQFYSIIIRHDTSTQWAVNNPILILGEYGVEDDTHRVKRGDGETEWNELPYEEFGLKYMITYKNLSGEVSDNEQLQEALNTKMSLDVFEDVDYQTVSSIDVYSEDGSIAKITRISKNIFNAETEAKSLRIFSRDNSIAGYWSVTNDGIRMLNLEADCTIQDYENDHRYYQNQLCFHGSKLYRAIEDFEAEPNFNEEHWEIVASLVSGDIKYDNRSSGLEAETVKEALDELKDLDSKKLKMTQRENKVYGTDGDGVQHLYDKDELRTVDSVNGVRPTNQEAKNIQIDASDINYDDEAETPETIKEKLDQKVDKTVAGEGVKIVRDVQIQYVEATGKITLIEDKVSLEDGESETEETEVDVVSETELQTNVNTLNTRITNEVDTLNTRVTNEVSTLNSRIDSEVDTLNDRVDAEVATLNAAITALDTKLDTEVDTLNDRIDDEVATLNARVDDEVDTLNDRVDTEVSTLNTVISTLDAKVDTQVSRLDTKIDTEVLRLDTKIDTEALRLDTKIDTGVTTLNTRITTEVATLNNTIDTEVDTLNDRIDTEVDTLNDRIDTEVLTLNTTINTKETAMDNKKVDKDISTLLVTEIVAAVDSSTLEPTMKITRKNTTTKESVINNLHFKAVGNIQTSFLDADHIVIDSSVIDGINTEQTRRLGVVDTRLNAHDTDIAALQAHDLSHDTLLATHTAQIALHEDRLDTDEANILELGQNIETEATTRENADSALSARITTNAVNITTKADKEFADLTNDKVVGKLESDAISNYELFNLKETFVSPVDGSSSTANIKIISSDNTVVATRLQDGTIDLATNLDTDVNYFVTTEIISTAIAAETVLDMTKLTPTDKQEVEIQDIITDPEGTWSRVKSIDTVNDTCTVVTFTKHAQAVWGTIKGNITDQQDLQAALGGLSDNKVDKTSAANKVYGTDNNGNQTTYDKDTFGKVDTVNNVQADVNKNVTLTSVNIEYLTESEKQAGTYPDVSLKLLLNTMCSVINSNRDVVANRIMTYTQGTQYNKNINVYGITPETGSATVLKSVECYVTFERNDGVVLMAKVAKNFTADDTKSSTYESLKYDVEQGNLVLVGIPEQQGTM